MKQKTVTAKLTETMVACKAYSDEQGVIDCTVHLDKTFKTENGLEKAVREELSHDNLGLVKIESTRKIYGVYTMPITEFIANATYSQEIPEEK